MADTDGSKLRAVLTHPVVKRLAVAAPISVGVGLLRTWLGEHSLLIGLLVGVGSYYFADWLFSEKSERDARIQGVTVLLRENWLTATKWGMCVLMCTYFLATRSEPSEPAVKQVLSLVQTFGLLTVFAVPAIISTIRSAIWGTLSPIVGLAPRFLKGLAFYSLALWVVGHSGDDLYKWVLAHPNDTAIGAVALAIVWMILRFSGGSSLRSESIARSSGKPTLAATASVKPTARDYRYTAAHEAGHALVYAALGGLPAGIKLAVNDHSDERGVLGFTTGISSKHHLDEKSFAEWYMLVLLAGKLGESIMQGESTLGSSNDYLRWLSVARSYLANHYRGMYYADPQNKFEQEQNEAKLEALQAEQLETLRALFDVNVDVFKQLANTLLMTRCMGRDDLIPFLSLVKLPDGFPLPFGPFETFAAEWRDVSARAPDGLPDDLEIGLSYPISRARACSTRRAKVDADISDDMMAVLQMVQSMRCYPDTLGQEIKEEFDELVRLWRPKLAKGVENNE